MYSLGITAIVTTLGLLIDSTSYSPTFFLVDKFLQENWSKNSWLVSSLSDNFKIKISNIKCLALSSVILDASLFIKVNCKEQLSVSVNIK